MRLAIDQARAGLDNSEVAVGCIFVYEVNAGAQEKDDASLTALKLFLGNDYSEDKTEYVIARSHNLTNATKNATTHCEINCIRSIADRLKC